MRLCKTFSAIIPLSESREQTDGPLTGTITGGRVQLRNENAWRQKACNACGDPSPRWRTTYVHVIPAFSLLAIGWLCADRIVPVAPTGRNGMPDIFGYIGDFFIGAIIVSFVYIPILICYKKLILRPSERRAVERKISGV